MAKRRVDRDAPRTDRSAQRPTDVQAPLARRVLPPAQVGAEPLRQRRDQGLAFLDVGRRHMGKANNRLRTTSRGGRFGIVFTFFPARLSFKAVGSMAITRVLRIT